MDAILKHFKTFHTVYVFDEQPNETLYELFASHTGKILKIGVEKCPAIKTHLLVFDIQTLSNSLAEKIAKIISSASSLYIILFCDEHKNYEIMKFALEKGINDVLSTQSDKKIILESLKKSLVSMSQKRGERIQNDLNKKIVENLGHFLLVKKNNKTLLANTALKEYLKASELSAIDEAIDSEKTAQTPLKNRLVALKNDLNDTLYLRETKILADTDEEIELFIKLGENIRIQDKHDMLSKIEFVQMLKKRLAHDSSEEAGTPVVCLKIDNSQKIIDQYGSEVYFDFLKELNNVLEANMPRLPYTYWYKDYLLFITTKESIQQSEQNIRLLFQAVFSHKFSAGIIPFLDVFILVLQEIGVDDSLNIIERLYQKKFTEQDSLYVYYKKSSLEEYGQDDTKRAKAYLEDIFVNKHPLKLLNTYKGLSINSSSKVLKIKDGNFYIFSENTQKCVMNIEKNVIIQSASFPKDMEAKVKYVDAKSPFTVIHEPKFIDFSANARTHIRVQCDLRIPVMMKFAKLAYTGELMDVSVQAIALRFRSNIGAGILNAKTWISCKLPIKGYKNDTVVMESAGEVIAIVNGEGYKKVVVNIQPEKHNEEVLLEYIYSRQKELVIEIKKLGSGEIVKE